MPAKTDPIGIFDSGVGGLPIAAAIREVLPDEHLVYYADRAHFPYGDRPEEEVRHLALDAAQLLLMHHAKLIVVACNTASSIALSALRSTYGVPFVGVVPGIKPGSLASERAKVGVLATQATFQTKVFTDLVSQFAQGVEVVHQVCPDLVALIEAGETGPEEMSRRLRGYIEPLLASGVDTLVLGCTHYSFLTDAIHHIAGPDVRVIDTALPVARQVQRVLEGAALLNDDGLGGSVALHASADAAGVRAVAATLWPQPQKEPV